MEKRELIKMVLDWKQPPYVPWMINLTQEAEAELQEYYGSSDLDTALENHMIYMGNEVGYYTDIGDDCVQDIFGVVWDRRIDKDVGVVKGQVLSKPTLSGYSFPDPLNPLLYADIPEKIIHYGDRFRVFAIGFSLYERAWSLRGLETLLSDFYDHPMFVQDLLHNISEYNIIQINEALTYDIDAVYFGDDWGQQRGLQMGPTIWKKFIFPSLKKMYGIVRDADKYVMIHSCGDIDELFDDLVSIGLNCFNPFQPEAMDIEELFNKYRERLAFFGGLSTQSTLPFGSIEDVRRETQRLLEMGMNGGYIFAPSQYIEGDVPLDNILAFLDIVQHQSRFKKTI